MRRLRTSGGERGFTLLELMIVMAILAVIASIGVPNYVSALRTARVGKAKHELKSIAGAITQFLAANGGQLPLTLYQVGFGGKADPWGVPYCYLNYADGTGDGLAWAVAAGLVNPAAFLGGGSSGSGSSGGGGGGGKKGGAVGPLPGSIGLGALAWLRPRGHGRQGGSHTSARSQANGIVAALSRTLSTEELEGLTSTIASSNTFSLYVGVGVTDTRRRDQFLLPLNDDYDLFSLGADGRTSVALSHAVAKDDVIRANNGGFFGVAGDY